MTKHSSPVVLAFLLISLGAAQAQPAAGRYIVEFDTDPAVVNAISGVRLADAAPRMAARRAQIQAEHVAQEAAIRGLGGVVIRRYDTVLNGMAIQIPGQTSDQAMAGLRALPGVRAVYPDKRWHTLLDQAVIAQHVTDTWKSLPGVRV